MARNRTIKNQKTKQHHGKRRNLRRICSEIQKERTQNHRRLLHAAARLRVVKEYALKLAGLTEETCTPVRPFYPGGDYRNYDYPADAYVIDNPPFSILSEIRQFYIEKGIKYFLFAPQKTLFSCIQVCHDTLIPIDVKITYDNGVNIGTGFVTNVLGRDILIKTAPELITALRRTIALTQGNKNNVLGVKNEYQRNLFPFKNLSAVSAKS